MGGDKGLAPARWYGLWRETLGGTLLEFWGALDILYFRSKIILILFLLDPRSVFK
jgi:hypothetical protein